MAAVATTPITMAAVVASKSSPPAKTNSPTTQKIDQMPKEYIERNKDLPLCPYAMLNGECNKGDECGFLHGNLCDLCNHYILHPFNKQQRDEHREECIKFHEQEMELSFAIQRSMDKTCGICMDTVLEKENSRDRRFGILEKCNHTFCLGCIRKWRKTKQFDSRTIRSCPECRVSSNFVIPSEYWVDTKEEKDKLIENYKKAMSKKPCKYFDQGRGECPFAGACFYMHAYPDGSRAQMPPPRQRRRQNDEGNFEAIRDMLLWDYLQWRDDRNRAFGPDDYLRASEDTDAHTSVLSETEETEDEDLASEYVRVFIQDN